MKLLHKFALSTAAIVTLASATPAQAHGSHWGHHGYYRGGVIIGYGAPYYYAPAYYGYNYAPAYYGYYRPSYYGYYAPYYGPYYGGGVTFAFGGRGYYNGYYRGGNYRGGYTGGYYRGGSGGNYYRGGSYRGGYGHTHH